jgi:serine/threonine protein kinase
MNHDEFIKRYKYDLRDKLGEGGFGDVFKAYDNYRDKAVAIKISKVPTEPMGIRLKKEVEMASRLPAHPNIAVYDECYTFALHNGEYDFGVLQYYEDGNLAQLLQKRVLSRDEIGSVLSQILSGLDFLHERQPGIIHRDLKPQNILMVRRANGEYVPKITDFGISKQVDSDKIIVSHSLTGIGTLSYSSPEQLQEKNIRRNTDLWSFGVIAYQAFRNELPFNTGEHASTSEAGRVELFRQINLARLPDGIDGIEEPWQGLIRRCLVADPESRIKSARECLDTLNSVTMKEQICPKCGTRVAEGLKFCVKCNQELSGKIIPEPKSEPKNTHAWLLALSPGIFFLLDVVVCLPELSTAFYTLVCLAFFLLFLFLDVKQSKEKGQDVSGGALAIGVLFLPIYLFRRARFSGEYKFLNVNLALIATATLLSLAI